MTRKLLLSLSAMLCMVTFCAVEASAQIAFGVNQQNGIVSGGTLVVGGAVNPSGTGVRLGGNAGFSQLIGINTFTIRGVGAGGFQGGGFQGGGNFGGGNQGGGNQVGGFANNNAPQNRRPTAAQFVLAAAKYDADRNRRLDRKELTAIGAAVLAELKQRKGANAVAAAAKVQDGKNGDGEAKTLTSEEMVEIFVEKCLSYDKDKDEMLNNVEATRMATALIRSLS